ncbi:DinB family protein [Algibacter amylolyticus]|uniref:DinB family protein n=1 Tax=Algibacter amylolyticus TaxID=1608400 RepID=A0A5M7BFR8_9FLAO|nr:DinB family protein [Algibacter amylolyticus]KAA5827357.1 DinB family protein [Algibacter amylolyticus]MBB5266544.1 putative damage-inducible protein DinB [Algibacter amylolyticus]TSJ81602.1 DinB family protein [Algibacter amylolyticus]
MNSRILQLVESLNNTFQGNPWYGDSLMFQLKNIDIKLVNKTLPNSKNSIANLIQHVINWRVFAIEKLQGNEAFDIEMNSEADWKLITIKSQKEWKVLLNELTSTQNKIIEILKLQKNDAFLEQKTIGKTYSLKFLIEGVVQHDLYHLGQIGLLNAYFKD